MVKVIYSCNIDSVRRWLSAFPEELVAIPAIGSRIRATKKIYIRETKEILALEMDVVGVVYGASKEFGERSNSTVMVPYVEIELHHKHAWEIGLL